MKKKHLILPVLSTILLAPAFLAHQVAADDVQPTTTVSNLSNSVQQPAETEVAPTSGESADEASVNAAIAANGQDASGAAAPEANLPEATILHTNDVHGRIVEEKGVIGDAKLAAVIKEERAKILNEIGYDAMAVGNHEFDFGLDEAKKYKEILNFPLLSSNPMLTMHVFSKLQPLWTRIRM